jgi:repressor LexA
MDELSDLTERQQQVLAYIAEFQRDHGIAPTVREIGDHFGLRSPGGIHRILSLLREKGFVRSDDGKKRSWRALAVIPEKGMPVLGEIAAGNPIETISFSDEQIAVSPSAFGSEDCFALRVSGDSMIDAHIVAGDLAVIRPQTVVENGDIVAVIIQDVLPEATLKIVRQKSRSLVLEPANRAYSAMTFKGAECGRVRILGKCVGIIRR